MIRLFLYLLSFSVIGFVVFQFYEKRKEVIPFDPNDFKISAPEFSEKELVLARFGKELFHETDFSKNGKVACGSCHKAEFAFADNTKFSQGVGRTALNTPSSLKASQPGYEPIRILRGLLFSLMWEFKFVMGPA